MNQQKLFQRNFTMVVLGQIISLFGNAILRYALPLYLLNQTHSAGLFGIVTACSFLPMMLLSPVGGIVADRVNKKNIMVILDYFTAGLVLSFSLLFHSVNLIALSITVLMILYGIQGAYQPAVQASIPLLVTSQQLLRGNAIINLVSSLSNLVGPVLGGILFGFFGLNSILYVSIVCFLISATMELFIRIPFTKQKASKGIFKIAYVDMKESFHFIRNEQPILGKVSLLLAGINLVFSALIIIGVPIIVNEYLGFPQSTANTLYSYAQGALAAGGLFGGVLAGIVGKKLTFQNSYIILELCSLSLLPIGLALLFPVPSIVTYLVIVICCFLMMALSTVFTIQMMTYAQQITPKHLLGKVMALVTCLVMSAHPLGQVVYGSLFDLLPDKIYLIFFIALGLCLGISFCTKNIIQSIPKREA